MKNIIFLLACTVCLLPSCEKKQGANDVYIDGKTFTPSTLTISKGTTITWTNKENVLHSVTSDNVGLFDSGDMGKNKTYSYTFAITGNFPYHCKYHSNMKGTIVVQ